MRPHLLCVLTAAAALLVLALAPAHAGDVRPEPLQTGADWPMYGASPAHNFSTGASPPANLGLVWSFSGNGTLGSAVVSSGFAYVADLADSPQPSERDLVVHRLAEADGRTAWSARIRAPEGRPLGPPRTLAVDASRVYALLTVHRDAANESREILLALNVADGQTAWRFAGTSPWNVTSPAATTSAPVLSGGLVVFGSQDGNAYAVDAASGALRWWFPTSGPVNTVPAVFGTIAYVTSNTSLYFLDVAGLANGDQGVADAGGWTGDLLQSVDAGAPIRASPVVAGSHVFLDAAGNLWAIDRTFGGAPVWSHGTPHESVGTPAILGDLILARRSDGGIYAFDRTSPAGHIVWVRAGMAAPSGGPDLAAADGRIFLSTAAPGTFDLVTLSAATGEVRDRNTTSPRAPLGSPIVAGSRVFVSEGGRLLAYRGQPDFAVLAGDVTLSLGTAEGGIARGGATVTVRNVGTEAGRTSVRVYDGAPDPATLLGVFEVGNATDPVDAGARTVIQVPARDWAVGRHDIHVVVARALTETNEDNNAAAVSVYVQAGPSPPPTVVGGGPYWVALLIGFAVAAAVLFFPIRRLRTLRRREDEAPK